MYSGLVVTVLIVQYVVTCDPPCVQGACVANDTCNCIEGYVGERCTEPGHYNYACSCVH